MAHERAVRESGGIDALAVYGKLCSQGRQEATNIIHIIYRYAECWCETCIPEKLTPGTSPMRILPTSPLGRGVRIELSTGADVVWLHTSGAFQVGDKEALLFRIGSHGGIHFPHLLCS